MDILLSAINILLIFTLAGLLMFIVFQSRSRAQIAFILFDVFVMVFVFGLELEILHSETIGAALSGLAVQYFGQCGFLIALLWFANEFIRLKLPKGIFIGQVCISILTMYGILSAGKNNLFYASMKIVHDGMYPRILCTRGVLWYVHYCYFFVVFLFVMITCIFKYHTMGPIHRRRIIYLTTGLGIFFIELIMKGIGIFGSYNPVSIALTGMVICLMIAVLREGYFDSIDATVGNVMNHGDEGLIVLDAWQRVIFANDKAYNLFPDIKSGLPLISQKSISDILEKNGKNMNIGGSIWEVRIDNILENNVKTATMIYFINVTTLVQQSEELKAINDERVRFMAKASHELRSPLNVVLGADEMILRETEDPDIREYADMIKEEVGGMVNLVEDIINSSLAEQEMLVIKEQDFSMKEVLVHLEGVYTGKAERNGLHFTLDWDGKSAENHEELLLSGDRNRLLQILINLLDNAVKYTEKGEFRLSAKTGKEADKKVVMTFAVSDTGTGIPEAEQEKVFEKYSRGKEATDAGKEGLGLGLSIVKGFLEAMGGTIELESHLGSGSTFTVTIPFNKANSDGAEAEEEEEEEEEEGAPSFEGRRVLAVDDRPRNILVIRRLLKESGITFDEAHDGHTAVEMCRNTHYDALIIDYMMPEMNGAETLKKVKNDSEGKNRDTYAIVFSANVTPDAERMYREEGFSDFLPKPVYYNELVKVLKKAFSHTDTSGEGADEDSMVLRLKKIGVNTDAGIEYSDGDEEFYIELLTSFAKDYTKERKDITEAYEGIQSGAAQLANGLDPWKEFTRMVHGVKGELRAFGDDRGADLFYSLEKDGKAKDSEDIQKTLPTALSYLENFVSAVTGKKS